MNIDEMRAFIAQAPWVFAKTMAETPHWYTHRKNNDTEAFSAAVMFIRETGERRKFGKATYTYLDLDGYSYWTMGARLDITIILNRAELAA